MYNRSSKAGLFLIELIILILFFAIASGICVQLFVNAHLTSIRSSQLNRAVLAAQSAAEAYKADADLTALIGGSSDGDGHYVIYSGEWTPLAVESSVDAQGNSIAAYRMDVEFSSEQDIGSALITVWRLSDNTEIYKLEAMRLETD